MNLKKIVNQIKSPCHKCPYKLGQVHTMVNPCPQCKADGYQIFEELQKAEMTAYEKDTMNGGKQ